MTVRDIIEHIEGFAKIEFQESYDNSGLQIGFPSSKVSKVLVCLDITEEVVCEAIEKSCEMIVSHHPLIFKGLKQISDSSYQQRCVVKAIQNGIAVYSAHTSLDNALDGVNHKIADKLGLQNVEWLVPNPDGRSGSGLVGDLPEELSAEELLLLLKRSFSVECLRHSTCREPRALRRVALCGGSGAFLLPEARKAAAQCFITGEFHYHDYFENEGLLLVELGHYQSEKFTVELLCEFLSSHCPEVEVIATEIVTNPILYY